MRRRRPLKTVRAIESNAGVVSAYSKALKRAYMQLRAEFIAELVKNCVLNDKKIAFDAKNATTDIRQTGILTRLVIKFLKAAKSVFMMLAFKFGLKAARATGRAQTEALKKAGIPAGLIREMFARPAGASVTTVTGEVIQTGLQAPAAAGGSAVGEPGRKGVLIKSGQDLTGFAISQSGDVTGIYRTDVPLNLKIGGGYMSERARAALPSIIEENTSLITRMYARDLTRLQTAAQESMEAGMSARELEALLGTFPGFDAGRARRVALDQVNKINTGVQAENSLALGMNKGVWIHVPGQYESRHSHEYDLNGKELDITQGIYDPEVKSYIMPAQLPYCRCIFRSVIPEELLQ